MTPTRWSLIADLFDRAAERPASERAAFLDAHAVGLDGQPDLALREEVERLLAADAPDGSTVYWLPRRRSRLRRRPSRSV